MPPNRPRRPSSTPGLDWLITDDGSLTLWDRQLQESYHSGCGAVAESLVVYLVHSGTYHRLRSGLPTCVFEMGLGTGTNLLLTTALADYFQTPLEYWAIEKRLLAADTYQNLELLVHLPQAITDNRSKFDSLKFPIEGSEPPIKNTKDELASEAFKAVTWMSENLSQCVAKILGNQPATQPVSSPRSIECTLLESNESIQHWCHWLSERIEVHLLIGDALRICDRSLMGECNQRFHAVYFDPFSTESNPELWTRDLLQVMYRMLQPHGTLASYCVKGSIRRLLQDIGFDVCRAIGPTSGKREVLQAHKLPPTSH